MHWLSAKTSTPINHIVKSIFAFINFLESNGKDIANNTSKFSKVSLAQLKSNNRYNRRRIIGLNHQNINKFRLAVKSRQVDLISLKERTWISPFKLQQNKIAEDYDFTSSKC